MTGCARPVAANSGEGVTESGCRSVRLPSRQPAHAGGWLLLSANPADRAHPKSVFVHDKISSSGLDKGTIIQNECHNSLFWAFVPKGASIKTFSSEDILATTDEINGRPSRKFSTRSRRNSLASFAILSTQPPAVTALVKIKAKYFHCNRRYLELNFYLQVSNLHLQFTQI